MLPLVFVSLTTAVILAPGVTLTDEAPFKVAEVMVMEACASEAQARKMI